MQCRLEMPALPPLGKILTADEIARFVARVAYPTSPVVLVDEELALAAPARAYGDWLEALGLPDLAEKACTLLPETAGGRAAADTDTDSGPARSDHFGSVSGRRRLRGERVRGMTLRLPTTLATDSDAAAVAALTRYYDRPYLGDDAFDGYVGAHFDAWSSTGDRVGEADRFTADDLVAAGVPCPCRSRRRRRGRSSTPRPTR